MKKLSFLFTFLFVIGLMASSAFAQPECVDDTDCDDGIECNGIETCDLDDLDVLVCFEGESPCLENQVCDTENDVCVDEIPMVSVDIKPGSCPNPLNVRSRGVLPVAIFGAEGFDVENIDPDSIGIPIEGLEELIKPIRYSYDDVGAPSTGDPCVCEELDDEELDEDISTPDGFMDLTLKFKTQELVDALGLRDIDSKTIIPLTIKMETEDGAFVGEDCVKIINNFKRWNDLIEEILKPKKPKKPKGPKNGDDE